MSPMLCYPTLLLVQQGHHHQIRLQLGPAPPRRGGSLHGGRGVPDGGLRLGAGPLALCSRLRQEPLPRCTAPEGRGPHGVH